MNAIRVLSCVCAVFAGLFTAGQKAAAAPVRIACSTAIDDYFSGRLPGEVLYVAGAQVTARGDLGHADITMAQDYSLATMPLNTPAASARHIFVATKSPLAYDGVFTEVFTDRGNNSIDHTELQISRTGTVQLRSLTWGGPWTPMQGVTCFRGPGNQTVVSGYFDYGGFYGFFTFVLVGIAPLP